MNSTRSVIAIFGIFIFLLACNNVNQEHHSTDVDAAAANAKIDSTSQISKDSVINRRPVSPTQ